LYRVGTLGGSPVRIRHPCRLDPAPAQPPPGARNAPRGRSFCSGARDLRRTVGLAAWGFFAFCTVGAVWFWPWYVTLLVALAAVSLHPAVAGPAVLLSLLAPLIYVVHAWIGEAGLLRPLPSWAHRYKPLVIFLPPLAWAAVALVRSWRDRRARNTRIGAY